MQKFTSLTGVAAPLPMVNIDTDMIIPKQYLKTIKRTGLGVHLFDEMRHGAEGPLFLSNHAGGILGGISTGQPVVARFAVKPTSSILSPRKTVDRAGAETEISTKGRHDPCVGIRAVPVGEAMMALVLADQALRHRGQVG